MNKKALRKNIPLYYALNVFGKPRFWVPVLYLYLTSAKLLSAESAIFLIGVVSLATTLFEIPTGIVADKYSRKLSVGIGYMLSAIAMLLLIFFQEYWIIFLLMALRGVATSFKSGADQALLYDTLYDLKEENDYKKHVNIARSYDYVVAALTTFLGGYLGSINLAIPLVLSVISFLIASAIAFSMTEPALSDKGEKLCKKGALCHTKEALQIVFSKKSLRRGLLLLFIFSGVITTVLKASKNIFTPIFDELGMDATSIGIAISLIYIAKAFGAFIASKFNKAGGELKETLTGLILFTTALVIMAKFSNPILTISLFMFVSTLESLISTNLNKLFNDKIPGNKRATILSIKSVFTEMIRFGFIVGFGYILGYKGFSASILFIASFAFITIIGLLINKFIVRK